MVTGIRFRFSKGIRHQSAETKHINAMALPIDVTAAAIFAALLLLQRQQS